MEARTEATTTEVVVAAAEAESLREPVEAGEAEELKRRKRKQKLTRKGKDPI